jgi:hypothetical protein
MDAYIKTPDCRFGFKYSGPPEYVKDDKMPFGVRFVGERKMFKETTVCPFKSSK